MKTLAPWVLTLLLGASGVGHSSSSRTAAVHAAPRSAHKQGGRRSQAPLRAGQRVRQSIPGPPSFQIQIDEPGEYSIDVTTASLDPHVYLYGTGPGEPTLIEENDDGGEGLNSRIVRFLEPGRYDLRVREHRARPYDAEVSVQRLAPLRPVATLEAGSTTRVRFPESPLGSRPRNDRDASRAVQLRISRAGNYACQARADNDRNPAMDLISDGRVLANDNARNTGNVATITTRLAPGEYVVRVRDWIRRGGMNIDLSCRAL